MSRNELPTITAKDFGGGRTYYHITRNNNGKTEYLKSNMGGNIVWTTNYNFAATYQTPQDAQRNYDVLMSKYKESSDRFVIAKECRIPGTNIILEVGDVIKPIVERAVSQTELDKIRDGLADFFKKNKDYYDVYVDKKEQAVCVEIDWGDWKHDHAYVNLQVNKYLDSIGVEYMSSEKVTDEDGSDTYSSIHIYHII